MLASAASWLASLPRAHWPAGHASCECIDPWAAEHHKLLNTHQPASPSSSCHVLRGGDQLCYASSYGARGCSPYDWTATPECARAEVKPDWCSALWCFVDASNCTLPSAPSAYFVNVTPTLFYSYETCGFVNTFASGSALDDLQSFIARQGGKLRVSFPGASGEGFTVVESVEDSVGPSNRSGSAIVFMDKIFADYGFEWEYVPISKRSHEYAPFSSFTACVHEVALGTTDMCFGNFWTTSSRLHISSFTAAFFSDYFVVITGLKSNELSLWETLSEPFKPFSPLLWLAFVLALAYAGLVIHYEANPNEKPSLRQFLLSSPVSMLKGLHAFNIGEVADAEIGTSGSWLTNVMVGFTVLVMVTGYTAAVTTQLIQRESSTITGIQDGIRRGHRFCVHTVVKEALVGTYPGLKALTVDQDQGVAELDAMDKNLCDTVITTSLYWENAVTIHPEHCDNKIRLQETVFSLPNAYPVRAELERVLSWAITKRVERGLYASLQDEARANYTRPDRGCPRASEEVRQFGLHNL
ncbi:MAG: hypothetical protein SGPRY_010185, partial [Prymnesium sp.]